MDLTALGFEDERLRTPCAEVTLDALRTREVQNEIDALLAFATGRYVDHNLVAQPSTVGLSANQVGLMKRICVMDFGIGRRGQHDWRIFVNPRVTWRSKQQVERVEGCVNFPEIWGSTLRPVRVKLAAYDRWGNAMTLDVSGWAATLIEHEVDHINGHLFVDRLTDPAHAHAVAPADYAEYRRAKHKSWPKTIDVRNLVRDI